MWSSVEATKKLKKKLQQKYKNRKEVRLVGYTKKMPLYLKACDVIFTKPGGLTSTEAAVSGIPIVHIRPIPGCETENRRFFRMLGMSVSGKTAIGQVASGVRLIHDEKKSKTDAGGSEKRNKSGCFRRIVLFFERREPFPRFKCAEH